MNMPVTNSGIQPIFYAMNLKALNLSRNVLHSNFENQYFHKEREKTI